MESKIQKQIVDYFSYFEEFYNLVKTCVSECHKCAVSIHKLINRCRLVKEAGVKDTSLEEFEGLQTKLCAALLNLISEETKVIQSNLSSIEDHFEKLCNKCGTLQESCNSVDFTQQTLLVKGTPLQPSLKQLLEFADFTISFGSEILAQVDTSLNVLSFKAFDTEFLSENFKISTSWKQRITEIISYTSFCSENEI